MKKIVENSEKYAVVVAGDFNTHFCSYNKSYSKKKLAKLDNVLVGFKNVVKKATYRRFNKQKNKDY